ncbi:cleavage stimulation factor subunit 77 isoform X3 [Syzygium oleosum]|uniref:cleavage stimulation factor subunit 77 isoform X3 n=1 Tax=Syzygium oleosum TaxID=219896 RepID=UPI0024B984D6|nr:cleavage stimulation factor subunit 77 isoform X3 [Syzygium oleosum]
MASAETPSVPESKDKAAAATAAADAASPAADKYSVEAAEALASDALHLPIADAAPVYEQLLAVFPTAAKFWKQYVEALMTVNNDDATKQIFSRCLLSCLHVPLWRCYIRFIRKVNEKKGVEGHEETRKAFDFMLGYVGADIASGPVWMDYITFLKSLPALNAVEESQRMTAVRKAYQKAIVTPTHHVEQLWRDYENFENSVSRQLAKGLISEYQPKYNSARAVYKERKKYVDEIDWNMLAVPPTGSSKEESQWMAWKRLLAFEKVNPQRIDTISANKRIVFTYEQCLMYLYHYPDIWHDYATWHAKSGSMEAAIKVFQRALKALPESELLRYAYAELEESRGAVQAAKKVYESLITDGTHNASLAHIQYIRFLRRTEGVEGARKYFLDARQSPNCTYHVYVAYATMALCLDKEPKVAHNVFEAGMKRFMQEPAYILEYADFLSRMNDDKNIRALFERALSSLPAEASAEVWKRFVQFEQTYGDLASVLKVEQRRKEAIFGTVEDGGSVLEGSLQDIVLRYSFMDLWPCSSRDLDHLSRQEWLSKNISKKLEKPTLPSGPGFVDRGSSGLTSTSIGSADIIRPNTSLMVIYDPRQKPVLLNSVGPGVSVPSSNLPNAIVGSAGGSSSSAFDDILKVTPPALVAFLANLPAVEGPTPDVDIVLSICLQSNIPAGQMGKSGTMTKQSVPVHAPSVSEVSGSSKSRPMPSGSSYKQTGDRQSGKRRGQDDDDSVTVQSQPLPRDVFRIRQIQKARVTSSQTGSTSYGSAFSGDLSGSTG